MYPIIKALLLALSDAFSLGLSIAILYCRKEGVTPLLFPLEVEQEYVYSPVEGILTRH